MIRIKSLSNKDTIHHFTLELKENIHNQLISFFNSLDFPQDELLTIDTPFSVMGGAYLYIHNDQIKVHFFIEEKVVHMVLDCEMDQKTTTDLMKKHFVFPK